MKKVLLCICVIVLIFLQPACSLEFICDGCGKEQSGTKHTFELLGENATLCNDCYKTVTEF